MSDHVNDLNSTLFNKIENNIQGLTTLHEDINCRYAQNNIHGILNLSVTFYEKSLEFISLSQHAFQHQIIHTNTDQANAIKENMTLLNLIVAKIRNKRDKWLGRTDLMQDLNFAQSIHNGEARLQNLEDKICYFLKIIDLAERKEADNQQPKMIKYQLR